MSTLKKWKIDDLVYSYDSLVDSFYIKYQEGEFSHNVDFTDWIIADVDDKGTILGIEFLGISKKIGLKGPINKQTACKVPAHLLPYLAPHLLISR